MSKVKQVIAEASRLNLLSKLQFGFELETQSLDGRRCSDGGDRELDDDRVYEYHDECIANCRTDQLNRVINIDSRYFKPLKEKIEAWLSTLPEDHTAYGSTVGALNMYEIDSNLDWYEDMEDYFRDKVIAGIDEYPDYCYVFSSPEFDLPNGLTWTEDQSVSGPEIKTEGPRSFKDCMKLLKKLFKRHELEVDAGCSFHIHVSVPGINHSYGKEFQSFLYEYIIQNIHRVPKSVQERWASSSVRYFEPRLSTDKFSFVHFHDRYKTWEFRCFGNVNNLWDSLQCLSLAAEALQYAYQRQLGLKTGSSSEVIVQTLKTACTSLEKIGLMDLHLKSNKLRQSRAA